MNITKMKYKFMAQYIDKSAVVAGIEDKINKYTKRGEESDAKRDGYGMYWGGVISCLNELRSFLDTLKVKEVDLEKEVNSYMVNEMKFLSDEVGYDTLSSIARHFYELGLKTKGE